MGRLLGEPPGRFYPLINRWPVQPANLLSESQKVAQGKVEM